jgi:apolipoprotein N-acyltransferase
VDTDDNRYNAIFAVLPDGSISETVYAKQRLVPFGEFVPMRPVVEFLVPPLASIGMLSEDLAKGESSAPIPTDKGNVGALVCFDSIYENLTAATVREGAQLICLSTNDSWFTDSAAVRMHHAQARLRAIESGRWIVRSADTGISSVISPTGKSFDEQPPLCEGVSISTVYLRDTRTVYSYIGNVLVYLLMAGISVFTVDGLVCAWRTRRKKQ